MNAARPASESAATPPAAAPKADDNCLNNRMMKIALAAIASLAAFMLLPFPTAALVSAAVVLGAILCTGESNLLTRASAAIKGLNCFGGSDKPPANQPAAPTPPPAPPVTPAAPVVSNLPTNVNIWQKQIDGFDKVRLSFRTEEIRKQFVENHVQKFKEYGVVTYGNLELVIAAHGSQTNATGTIMTRLGHIFGPDFEKVPLWVQ